MPFTQQPIYILGGKTVSRQTHEAVELLRTLTQEAAQKGYHLSLHEMARVVANTQHLSNGHRDYALDVIHIELNHTAHTANAGDHNKTMATGQGGYNGTRT